jgi:UDP-N-acetylglucosamine--N-acetylmuramyl-(pentapeptide) pyrophosphoryl-undecaprenol N-acetylglucosamine transferase
VLCGGGTGGHVYPALCVAEALRRAQPRVQILYLGGDRMERRAVPAAGLRFQRISVHGISGRGLGKLFSRGRAVLELLLLLPLLQSLRHLRRFRAQVVIGTGGYVTGPVILAARLLKIPSITLEGNRTPGFTSRMVSRLVDVVAVGWSDQARNFTERLRPGARVVTTGLPVRRELATLTREEAAAALELDPRLTTLSVIGGSLGSRKLNESLVGALRLLGRVDSRMKLVQVLHVTGDRVGNRVTLSQEDVAELAPRYRAVPFLEAKYPHALAASDLVITRGGASTVAELTARAVPAIVVPWAQATTGEQERNVEPLCNTGGAIMIRDRELNPDMLASTLRTLLWDKQRLEEMSKASRLLGKPHAADEVAELAFTLIEMKKRGPAPRRKREES